MPSRQSQNVTSEIAIFGRLLRTDCGELSQDLAQYLLSLGFDKTDQARMLKLAEKNQRGKLTDAEQDELNTYVRASHLLALLHSKARQSLSTEPALASR